MRRILLVGLFLASGVVGGCAGASAALSYLHLRGYPGYAEHAVTVPMPYHVPPTKGGASLRLAMVHDVIHERFATHGGDFYRDRNRRRRAEMAAAKESSPEYFAAAEDLAVGLERLGDSAGAAAVVRDVLAKRLAAGQKGRELYTTYANLGTFLIHDAMAPARKGDVAARKQLTEGRGYLDEAVKVNPDAHFGREKWQQVVAAFLAASVDAPELLQTYDCVGNRLDREAAEMLRRNEPLRIRIRDYEALGMEDMREAWARGEVPRQNHNIRRAVRKVGGEKGWHDLKLPGPEYGVAFDEPTLGVVGMWREGGGANPHFCLMLGETMLRIDQRRLAWAAFERCERLAASYSPDAKTCDFLREHCRSRKSAIEADLASPPPANPSPTALDDVIPPSGDRPTPGDLRRDFDAALAEGLAYRKAYRDYETAKIAEGADLAKPGAYDAFHAANPPVTTTPGPEEWYTYMPWGKFTALQWERGTAFGLLGAGLAMFAVAGADRRWSPSAPLKATIVDTPPLAPGPETRDNSSQHPGQCPHTLS